MTTDALTVTLLLTHSVGDTFERTSLMAPVLMDIFDVPTARAVEPAPRCISAVFPDIFVTVALVRDPPPITEKSVVALVVSIVAPERASENVR